MYENIDKKHLLLLMEEAYFLPSDDIKRKNIESIVENFAWAKEQWELLQKENSVLCQNLHEVKIPVQLKHILLQIPHTKRHKTVSSSYISWGIAIAASFIFIIGYIFYTPQTTSLQNLAVKSIKWHNSDAIMDIQTSQREALSDYFVTTIGMKPNWTKVDDRFSLHGGKVLLWDNKNVLCSVWHTDLGSCTLIQFDAKDFNLPENKNKEVWDSSDLPQENINSNFLCMLWIKNNSGHVWVIENKEGARDLFSLVQK